MRAVIAAAGAARARRAAADAVIYNEGISLDELAAEVDALLAHRARSSA